MLEEDPSGADHAALGMAFNPMVHMKARQQPYMAVGTVSAPPSVAHFTALTTQPTPMVGLRKPPPARGQWSDGLCDWPSNLFPSCYCVVCGCYGTYLVAQMAEKTGYSTFRSVLWGFAFSYLVGLIMQVVVGGALIVWVPLLYAFITALLLRLHVVEKDQITELSRAGECCVGFWCWYCSVAQMARHVYGYTKVLDGDGDPYRIDSYAV